MNIFEILSEAVAILVVVSQLLGYIRDWRGGPPELRLIRELSQEYNERMKTVTEILRNNMRELTEVLKRLKGTP
jgi:hypothetical protein